MTRKEFQITLIFRLQSKCIEINEDAIKSAMGKTVRHMNNTIGGIEWSEEQLGNAECFYQEYGTKKPTFNESMYRSRNTGTSYR